MNTVKIRHKGSAWSHHGKHFGRLVNCIMRNKGPRPLARVREEPKFDTVAEAVSHYSRR